MRYNDLYEETSAAGWRTNARHCSIVTRVCRATYRQQLAPFVTGNIIPNKGILAQHIRVGHYIIFGDEITET